MTRHIPALLLLAAAVYAALLGAAIFDALLWWLAEEDEPDEMAQPFLDGYVFGWDGANGNSATYLYNARTGVISSYN